MRDTDFPTAIISRDKVCQMCGSDTNLQAHHIIPVSEGGADDLDNGIALCASCHADQHPNVPRAFITSKRKRFCGEILRTVGVNLYEKDVENLRICRARYAIGNNSALVRFVLNLEARRIRGLQLGGLNLQQIRQAQAQ